MSSLNPKSITCFNIPPAFLDKKLAKKHFSCFGNIKSFSLRPNRLMCTVEYDKKEQALEAKLNAGNYKGQFFNIEFTTLVSKPPTPDPDIDPDVQSELQALRELSRGTVTSMGSEFLSIPKFQPQTMVARKTTRKDDIQMELDQLLSKQYHSAEERYRALEVRDKLLRIKLQKDLSEQKSKYTIGTCPDMCPEKERLMRDFQNQVSIFEMHTSLNQMNPKITVKQYSRSSADQEAPLPHDLRSEDVLEMTMSYLICNLVDSLSPSNVSEWFHFLWDRMRSIRKDITQQNLCSLKSVTLLEQCARFHVHCSARLVEEGAGVFDPKLNTENLTKCLQSLKYMYDDLRLKGTRCENEAEFRAFIVLLNLNDGNFLWEFKQLTSDILGSSEMKFALACHSAISSNNYVQFFRLVEQTTYLNACILLRYFTQVRIKALKLITKSYAVKSMVVVSLDYLARVLKFEDAAAAFKFVEYHYKYEMEADMGFLTLDPFAFDYDTLPYPTVRSLRVVESKCGSSVGRVINGRECDDRRFREHVVHDSFDEYGNLTKKGLLSLANYGTDEVDRVFKVPVLDGISPKQLMSKLKRTSTERAQGSPTQNIFTPPKPTVDNVTISSADSIFSRPVFNISAFAPPKTDAPMFPILKTPPFSVPKVLEPNAPKVPRQPISFSTPSPPISIVPETLNNLHQPKQNTFMASMETKPVLPPIEKLPSIFPSQVSSAPKVETAEDLQKARVAKIEKESEALVENVLSEVVESEVRREVELAKKISFVSEELPNIIFEEILEEISSEEIGEIAELEVLAENIIEARKVRNTYKVLKKWQTMSRRKSAHRKQVDQLPIYLPSMSLEEAAQEFRISSANCETSISAVLKPFDCEKKMLEIRGSKLIDVEGIFLRRFKGDRNLFWSGLISLSDEKEADPKYCSHMDQWLSTAFGEGRFCDGVFTLQTRQKYSEAKLALCLTKRHGIVTNVRSTSGVIFFVQESRLKAARRRLQTLLESAADIPIAVVVTHCPLTLNKAEVETELDGHSNFLVLLQRPNDSLKERVEQALDFVSHGRDVFDVPLEMEELGMFLTQTIGAEMWRRASRLSETNEVVSRHFEDPNAVVEFFNRTIKNAVDVVSRDFSDYPDFPEALRGFVDAGKGFPLPFCQFPRDWRSVNVRLVVRFLHSLILPRYSETTSRDHDAVRKHLLNYIQGYLPKSASCDRLADCAVLHFENDYGSSAWVNIFRIVTSEKIEVLWRENHLELPKAIVCDRTELTSYVGLGWLIDSLKSRTGLKRPVNESQLESKRTRTLEATFEEDLDLEQILKRAEACASQADSFLSEARKHQHMSSMTNEVLLKYRDTAQYLERNQVLLDKYKQHLKE